MIQDAYTNDFNGALGDSAEPEWTPEMELVNRLNR
jgi:hypothetical protein